MYQSFYSSCWGSKEFMLLICSCKTLSGNVMTDQRLEDRANFENFTGITHGEFEAL